MHLPLISEIAGAWLDTLLDVIDLLPKDLIKKEVRNKFHALAIYFTAGIGD